MHDDPIKHVSYIHSSDLNQTPGRSEISNEFLPLQPLTCATAHKSTQTTHSLTSVRKSIVWYFMCQGWTSKNCFY